MTPTQIERLKRSAVLLEAAVSAIQKAKLLRTSLAEARELIVEALDEETSSEQRV